MADFRIAKRQKPAGQDGGKPREMIQTDPETSRSLLSHAGGAAMSSLHTAASVLSTPARVLYGGINGALGLRGGFGNMNPFDSTGGIEGADLLENLGLHPKNDPNKWELSDFTRFGVNLATDPLTWTGLGALTKTGVAASKLAKGTTGSLSKGVLNQIRNGERSLLSLHAPLSSTPIASLGTGAKTADAITSLGNKTGAFKIAKAVVEHPIVDTPIRHVNAMLRAPFAGKVSPQIQKFAVGHDEARRAAWQKLDADTLAIATKIKNANLHGPDDARIFRDVLEGVHNPAATAEHHALAGEMKAINDRIHQEDMWHGIKTGDLANDDVRHFVRRMSNGIDSDALGAHNGFEMGANKVFGRDETWKQLGGTNAINDMLTNPHLNSWIEANSHLSHADLQNQVRDTLRQLYGKWHVDPATGVRELLNDTMEGGGSRFADIAAKMTGKNGAKLRQEGLFNNHPLQDLRSAAHAGNNRHHNARLVFDAIADGLHNGPHGVSVRNVLGNSGFVPEEAAINLAAKTGHSADDILGMHINDDLANELRSLTPGYRAPPAESKVLKAIKDAGAVWKASVLAHPASRVRDAASGVVQNFLMGHAGKGGWDEARNIAHGVALKHDYSKIPEVADLIARHGLSPDEAVKIHLAVQAPRTHGAVADIAPGQVGSTLEDVLNLIPGNTKSGLREVMGRAAKSFRHGELGPNGVPIAEGAPWNPINIAGVGDRTHTGYGPGAASNVISGATDEFNRHAGILGQMQQGFDPSVAGKATRAAQVDYDPSTFTPFESHVLKQIMPFYSFGSRMGKHTAVELATNPGGRLGQLLKAQDRAHAQDASIPDHILDGTAIPLGQADDGTKKFISQLGLMHEPAVKMLGSAAGGDTRGALYDTAGMLHPLLKMPLEHMTGQSFYQHGADSSQLTPTIGQTLANIGTVTGLRDKDAGAIQYPGSNLVESALQLSPLSRLASSARTLSDPRKTIAEKILNTTTGAKVADVSPKQQSFTLMRRAESLAKSQGAHSRSEVYFSKKELEALEKTDPVQAKKQRELQALLNALKAKQATKAKDSKTKAKSGEIRLSKSAT